MRFQGKVALVTGSSRNIGRAIAERFAGEGAAVVLNARESADELDEAALELRSRGGRVLPVLADVADPGGAAELVRRALAEFSGVDVLVMCHSVRPLRRFLDVTPKEWHAVMGANLHSAFHLCQAVLPGMVVRGGGSVIAIGSDFQGSSGYGSQNLRPHVFAALAARANLMRNLVTEFAPHGIRFNFVSPGVIRTVRKHPEWYPASSGQPHEDETLLRSIPMGRVGEPVEVADAVLWLASEEASYVNGTTISVNGGWRQ
jgi:3-oxoacyl-[acyl-carrier protein] reductase